MTNGTPGIGSRDQVDQGQPQRPFSYAEAKQTFEEILDRINVKGNDVANADFWALERGERAGNVSSAIKLDKNEVAKLVEALDQLPPGLGDVILTRVIPERTK